MPAFTIARVGPPPDGVSDGVRPHIAERVCAPKIGTAAIAKNDARLLSLRNKNHGGLTNKLWSSCITLKFRRLPGQNLPVQTNPFRSDRPRAVSGTFFAAVFRELQG